MNLQLLAQSDVESLADNLSDFIGRIEEACERFDTDPALTVPESFYLFRECLDAIWHVTSEGLETYLDNAQLESELQLITSLERVISGTLAKWDEFSANNCEEDRLSIFMDDLKPDMLQSIAEVCHTILNDTTGHYKFLRMVDEGDA